MNRPAIVAGAFYPGGLIQAVSQADLLTAPAFSNDDDQPKPKPLMLMLPHAGWVYSGKVAGMTIAAADLPQDMIILGPCHKAVGQGLSVWSSGYWETPVGAVPVNEELAAQIIESDSGYKSDTVPHAQDHCIEVLLPLLKAVRKDLRIVPIAVSQPDPDKLRIAALALAEIILSYEKAGKERPCIIVSSDMSHYISSDEARKQDARALEAVVQIDGPALYETVRKHNISMCGVLPATLALQTCKALGASEAQLISYANSGMINGDMDRVVGYAGVMIG